MFPFGKSVPHAIHPATKEPLRSILAEIYATVDSYVQQDYNVVKVIGHTDSVDTPQYNRNLSRQRAEYLADSIQAYLDREYTPKAPLLVQAAGYGEFAPLPPRPNETHAEYMQRNRRVELVFSFQRFPDYVPE